MELPHVKILFDQKRRETGIVSDSASEAGGEVTWIMTWRHHQIPPHNAKVKWYILELQLQIFRYRPSIQIHHIHLPNHSTLQSLGRRTWCSDSRGCTLKLNRAHLLPQHLLRNDMTCSPQVRACQAHSLIHHQSFRAPKKRGTLSMLM